MRWPSISDERKNAEIHRELREDYELPERPPNTRRCAIPTDRLTPIKGPTNHVLFIQSPCIGFFTVQYFAYRMQSGRNCKLIATPRQSLTAKHKKVRRKAM